MSHDRAVNSEPINLESIAGKLVSETAQMKRGWFGRYISIPNGSSNEIISPRRIQEVLKYIKKTQDEILKDKSLKGHAISILNKIDSEYSKCKSIFDIFRLFDCGSAYQARKLRKELEIKQIDETFQNLPPERKLFLSTLQKMIRVSEQSDEKAQSDMPRISSLSEKKRLEWKEKIERFEANKKALIELKKQMIEAVYPSILPEFLEEIDSLERIWNFLCSSPSKELRADELTCLMQKYKQIVFSLNELRSMGKKYKKKIEVANSRIQSLKEEFFLLLSSTTEERKLWDDFFNSTIILPTPDWRNLEEKIRIYQLEGDLVNSKFQEIVGPDNKLESSKEFQLKGGGNVKLRGQFIVDAMRIELSSQFLANQEQPTAETEWERDKRVKDAYGAFVQDLDRKLGSRSQALLEKVLNFMEQGSVAFSNSQVKDCMSILKPGEVGFVFRPSKQEFQISINEKVEITLITLYGNTVSQDNGNKKDLGFGIKTELKLVLGNEENDRFLSIDIERLKTEEVKSDLSSKAKYPLL